MKNLNGKNSRTKAKNVIKFNKCYDALNYFILKNNELYRQKSKFGQSKQLIMYNYSVTKSIKKVYTQLKYVKTLKIFAKIKQFYYKINKQIIR